MLPEARYDEYGTPLCRSNVGESIWSLYQDSPVAFKQAVREYFELRMPNWTVVSVNFQHRVIWLRDDRRRNL